MVRPPRKGNEVRRFRSNRHATGRLGIKKGADAPAKVGAVACDGVGRARTRPSWNPGTAPRRCDALELVELRRRSTPAPGAHLPAPEQRAEPKVGATRVGGRAPTAANGDGCQVAAAAVWSAQRRRSLATPIPKTPRKLAAADPGNPRSPAALARYSENSCFLNSRWASSSLHSTGGRHDGHEETAARR